MLIGPFAYKRNIEDDNVQVAWVIKWKAAGRIQWEKH